MEQQDDFKNRSLELLNVIKDYVEKISTDTRKVYRNGNRSATIRARKDAMELKEVIKDYRKELLKLSKSIIKTRPKKRIPRPKWLQ